MKKQPGFRRAHASVLPTLAANAVDRNHDLISQAASSSIQGRQSSLNSNIIRVSIAF